MPATKRAAAPATKAAAPAKRTVAKKAAAPAKKVTTAKKTAAATKKTTVAKKAAAPAKKATVAKRPSAPAKKATVKKAAPAPAKKVAAKKATTAKKTVTKKTAAPAAKKTTAAARKAMAPARRTPVKKAEAPTVTVQNVVATAPEAPATEGGRWRGHPVAAGVIRAVAMAVPLASSIVSGVVLSRLIHRPSSLGGAVGWWFGLLIASTIVLVAVDRVARRILPLATLLKLAMAFPDAAPSRFSVAARAGTTRSLQEQLRRAQDDGVNDEPAQAAHRILTLVGALGAHDRRTRGHSERVRAFNDLIAQELRLSQHDRDRLRWAALLHDIGKLHVPTRILNKPKKPTDKEWAILKSHPARGARITAPLASWLGPWAATIEQHHERWDGAGYPHGLSETDICLGARIVAVADAYEVMTAPRPYSRPVSAAAARAELARCAGDQFDPEVVRAFLSISIGRLRKVIGPISWLAQLPLIGATPRLEATVGIAGRQVVSAAATATGTGVLAAAMLPQAAHAHHHHHYVDHFVAAASSGVVTAPAHAAQRAETPARHAASPATQAAATVHHAHASKRATTRAQTGQSQSPTDASAPADNTAVEALTPSTPDLAPQTSTPHQVPATKPAAGSTTPVPQSLPSTQAPQPAQPQPSQAQPSQPQQPAANNPGQPPQANPAPKQDGPSNDDKHAAEQAKKDQEAANKAAQQAAEQAKQAQEAANKAAQQAAELAAQQSKQAQEAANKAAKDHGH